jgi:hypothetical protein
MSTHPFLMASVLSATLAATPLLAGQGAGQGAGPGSGYGAGGQGLGACDPTTCLASTPYETLDDIEAGHLEFMREEEKVARDLYLAFAELWDWPQFTNIAASEQQHMDSVKFLLEKYAIADPIEEDVRGSFTNPDLQALYDRLLTEGEVSATEAFRVAALVEEVDIADLDSALAQTDNQDLTWLFDNLQRGSRNHLRAFAGTLETLTGTAYSAQWLAQEQVDEILAEKMEGGNQGQGGRGAGNQGGGGQGMGGGRR